MKRKSNNKTVMKADNSNTWNKLISFYEESFKTRGFFYFFFQYFLWTHDLFSKDILSFADNLCQVAGSVNSFISFLFSFCFLYLGYLFKNFVQKCGIFLLFFLRRWCHFFFISSFFFSVLSCISIRFYFSDESVFINFFFFLDG